MFFQYDSGTDNSAEFHVPDPSVSGRGSDGTLPYRPLCSPLILEQKLIKG